METKKSKRLPLLEAKDQYDNIEVSVFGNQGIDSLYKDSKTEYDKSIKKLESFEAARAYIRDNYNDMMEDIINAINATFSPKSKFEVFTKFGFSDERPWISISSKSGSHERYDREAEFESALSPFFDKHERMILSAGNIATSYEIQFGPPQEW